MYIGLSFKKVKIIALPTHVRMKELVPMKLILTVARANQVSLEATVKLVSGFHTFEQVKIEKMLTNIYL